MKKKNIIWPIILVVEVLLAFASYKIGATSSISSDFNAFWQAGKNYGDGVPLYSQIGGASRYIYPPFAAMLFRLLALFSLQTAGAIFCFINFQLWAGVFYFSRAILRLCNIPTRQINMSLLAGFILSFRYFFYHVHFIQMNEIVLVMSLAGIKTLLEKKYFVAMGLLVMATFIKIIPVFLLLWALSKSKWKTYFYAAIFAILCLGLPLLIRGVNTGVQDLKDYYTAFLGPVASGRVEVGVENQGLSSALYKVFTVTNDGTKYGYFITELPSSTLNFISKGLLLLLLATYISVLIYSRFVKKVISVLEISFTLLFTLLVTGVTWEYHFVSYGFVFTVLFTQFLHATKKEKYIFYVLLALAFINDIIGASTVGYPFFYKSCGYSFLTLLALILAILQAWCIFSKNRNYPVITSFSS